MSEPIACSLTGPDLKKRLVEIAAVGKTGRRLGDELRFPADVRGRLEAIIAAESHCCPFLVFELREAGDELALRVGASSEEGEAIAAELRDAFRLKDGDHRARGR
jgi:MerR family transcriptional regulator, copper efflux regulator